MYCQLQWGILFDNKAKAIKLNNKPSFGCVSRILRMLPIHKNTNLLINSHDEVEHKKMNKEKLMKKILANFFGINNFH